MRYSTEPRDCIFVKDYGFLSFVIYVVKITGINIKTNLWGKCDQKFLHHAKQFTTDALKNASKKAEEFEVAIGNKIVGKIKGSPKTVPSKTDVEFKQSIEIPRERYISPEKTPQIIDEINLLDNITNHLSKFRAQNWIEITDHRNRVYAADKQIKFKTLMKNSILCNYKDTYTFVKGWYSSIPIFCRSTQ